MKLQGLQQTMKRNNMKTNNDELRETYNFDYAQAQRGKYYNKLKAEVSNIVQLEPDLAEVFKDSEAVNKALRSLLQFNKATQELLNVK